MLTRRRTRKGVDNPETTSAFSRLPLELQWKVWEYVCPHLSASSPLVLPFGLGPTGRTVSPDKYGSLAAATATARTVLSTHAAFRFLALRALPHAITFKRVRAGAGVGMVRLNSERDLILLLPTFPRGRTREVNCAWRIPGFSEHVVNLTTDFEPVDFSVFIDMPTDSTYVESALHFYECFPNLRAVYPPCDAGRYGEEGLRWCRERALRTARRCGLCGGASSWRLSSSGRMWRGAAG
ncbi:uncharacterized protein DNG_04336 [Cephalotrichum gorgonifer]|uniref:2EXR domain-containing protein n=1 Tax=Cephalotrichum gorgonifer TaxID=2041049 RepID=A0AAE8SUF9_9PEZI|nr:uncharacterized protein DNG_04336 [Cephalotrichum gorgonifer]